MALSEPTGIRFPKPDRQIIRRWSRNMSKLARMLCAVAAVTLVTAPVAAQTGDERPSGASVSPDTAGKKNKKRCRSEEYVDADGNTKRRNRCAGGFLMGGAGLAGLGGGGAVVAGGLALGGLAMAASSGSAESP
jgi:hypothetical protein